MRPLRLIAEVMRQRWAMTPDSLHVMSHIIDRAIEGGDITGDDSAHFHQLAEDDRNRYSALFGKPVEGSRYSSVGNGVGYLSIDGPVIPRGTWMSDVSGLVSLSALSNEFKALEADPKVKTIALLVDSPGGAVSGVSDFAALVKASEKKTTAFVTGMAASAAYWIGSAVDHLVSSDAGMVGSIGTVLSFYDTSKQEEKRGIQYMEIVSSQSPDKRPDHNTEGGVAVLQREVDDLASVFVDTVAANRGTTSEDVLENYGQGAVLVAPAALEAGMIDEISDVHSFVSKIEDDQSFFSSRTQPRIGMQSATSAQTAEGNNMSEEAKPKTALTAEDLRTQHASAVGEIIAQAKADERDRIQSIEALVNRVKTKSAAAKAAAVECINDHKFDPKSTPESVGLEVLEAVSAAQDTAFEAEASERRAASNIAAHASQAKPKDDKEVDEKTAASQSRVNGMKAVQERINK